MNVLGRTGLPVSRLGLGLAALGRPGYINLGHADDLDARLPTSRRWRSAPHAVLDAALAGGVRYLDAARSYGRAEAFLAAWLRVAGIRPAASPSARSGATPTPPAGASRPSTHEVKDHSRAVFARQLGREPRRYSAPTCSSTRSIRRRSTAASSTTRHPARARRRCATTGLAIGLTLSGPRQAETLHGRSRPHRRRAAVRRRAGDLEPARTLRRRRAARRARRRPRRHRQGRPRQRPAHRPQPRAEPRRHGAPRRAPARRSTRWPSPPSSPSPGSTSS